MTYLYFFLATPIGQVGTLGYGHGVTPGQELEKVDERMGMMD